MLFIALFVKTDSRHLVCRPTHLPAAMAHPGTLAPAPSRLRVRLRVGAPGENLSLFFAVLVAFFESAGFAPKQKYTAWTVSLETVCTAKSRPRKNQSARICPRLALPYNKYGLRWRCAVVICGNHYRLFFL